MREEKGITLIALIVTIIVLVILAVVSITAISDNDKGVVSKAKQAAIKTEEAGKEEDDEIKSVLEYPENNKTDKNPGTDVEEVENAEPIKDLITEENYGEKVNYSANGVDDWRIFYEDEDGRVFLIAEDYLPTEKVPTDSGLTIYEKYQAFWTATPTFVTPTQSDLFEENGLNSSYNNSKCASTLLDTSRWTEFVDSDLADYAIGSPTIQMWFSSWNEKYDDDFSLTSGTRGYVISGGDLSLGYDEALENDENTGYGNVYFPHPNTGYVSNGTLLHYEGCGGYWLASPADGTPNEKSSISYMFIVNGRGAIITENPLTGDPNGSSNDKGDTPSTTDAIYNGIRPVVVLKDGVKAVQDSNGIWNLSV